jgi:hypothetical protein
MNASEYVGRLYFALMEVPILTVTFLGLGARPGPQAPWRRALPWVLLAVSLLAMALDAGTR